MAEIKVPKPPKHAFNPNRPASDLLQAQVKHMEWAIRHAGERRRGYKVKRIKTEADATARMAKLLPRLESTKHLPFAMPEISAEPAPLKPRRTKKPSKGKRKATVRR